MIENLPQVGPPKFLPSAKHIPTTPYLYIKLCGTIPHKITTCEFCVHFSFDISQL